MNELKINGFSAVAEEEMMVVDGGQNVAAVLVGATMAGSSLSVACGAAILGAACPPAYFVALACVGAGLIYNGIKK